MRIVPTTSPDEPPPGEPLIGLRRLGRSIPEAERPIPAAVEPSLRAISPLPRAHDAAPSARARLVDLIEAPAAPASPTLPRWIEPERDYRSPTPIERARLLRAAYEASIADPEQRLLIAELMAHYRAWCLRHGKGDPFAGLARG